MSGRERVRTLFECHEEVPERGRPARFMRGRKRHWGKDLVGRDFGVSKNARREGVFDIQMCDSGDDPCHNTGNGGRIAQ